MKFQEDHFLKLISSSYLQSVIQRLILLNYSFNLGTNLVIDSGLFPTCSSITANNKFLHHFVIQQTLANIGSFLLVYYFTRNFAMLFVRYGNCPSQILINIERCNLLMSNWIVSYFDMHTKIYLRTEPQREYVFQNLSCETFRNLHFFNFKRLLIDNF